MNAKQLLAKLAETYGPLSVDSGVLWFEDGTSVDLTILATKATATTVAITVQSEALGPVVLIAPEGMGVVEAEALVAKVASSLTPGQPGDMNDALVAYENAGFTLPTYATVDLDA